MSILRTPGSNMLIEAMLQQYVKDNEAEHGAWLKDKHAQTRLIKTIAAEIGAPESFVRRAHRTARRDKSPETGYLDLEEFKWLFTTRVTEAANAAWKC
jgi:hypothetical protein